MSSKKRKSSVVTEESSATMAAIKDEFALEIRDAPPAHLLINTRSFYKSQKHETKEYVAGDYQWRLIIYPEGRDFNKGGDYISVYLSLSNTDALPEGWEFNADCCILVKNQISNNYFCFRVKKRRFNALSSEWGLSISKKMLPFHGFFVHDKCVFGAEVYPHETRPVACLSLFDWKISNFSKLEGDLMTSEAFLVGGLRWKIRLYPKGHIEERDKSVSIYMACDDSKSFAPHEKAEANFCFRIKNQLSQAHLYRSWSHEFTSSSRPSGFINFIPIAEMCDPNKGFLIDDCCFLEVQIHVKDVVYTPKHQPLII